MKTNNNDPMIGYRGVSENCGWFEVVSKDENNNLNYFIIFDDDITATPVSKNKYNIMNGKVAYKFIPESFIGYEGPSNGFGNIKVVGYVGKKFGQHEYEVELSDGRRTTATKNNIENGKISWNGYRSDPRALIDYCGESYNDGPFDVINHVEGSISPALYEVMFTETGNTEIFNKSDIMTGHIRDKSLHNKKKVMCRIVEK
jgi:hypothetical protein